MREVLIVQPYLPMYRVQFFNLLEARLRSSNIQLSVAAPSPFLDHAHRGDAVEQAKWAIRLPDPKLLSFRSVTLVSFRDRKRWSTYDAIVLPAAANYIDGLTSLLKPSSGPRVALWGHIADFITRSNPLDNLLERWMLNRCDRVFAYTPRGACVARSWGVRPDRITTLNNTVDTGSVTEALTKLDDSQMREFTGQLNIQVADRVFGYIGAIDEVKRIDYLASVLEYLYYNTVKIKLLVAGLGSQIGMLDTAVERGQVVLLGYADAITKAKIGKVAEAILNPGRIGLLAVDALTLGIPIVTSEYEFHGPEVDYLEEGTSLHKIPGGPEGMGEFLSNATLSGHSGRPPLLESMVERFASGVEAMLG